MAKPITNLRDISRPLKRRKATGQNNPMRIREEIVEIDLDANTCQKEETGSLLKGINPIAQVVKTVPSRTRSTAFLVFSILPK